MAERVVADCTGLGQTGQGLLGSHKNLERGRRGRSMNLGLGQLGSHRSLVTPVVMRAGCS